MNNTEQIGLFEARERRDDGIARATTHAEDEAPGWNRDAYNLLLQYLAANKAIKFLVEEFRAWGEGKIEPPPDGRAWGAPIVRAKKRGVVVKVGYRNAKSSNTSPKPEWQEAKYVG